MKVLDKGCFLVEMLRKCPIASVLTSPEETARWEMELNRIALGEQLDTKFLVNIKKFVTSAVAELKRAVFDMKNFQAPAEEILENLGNCPACGHPVHENRKAFSCGQKPCSFVVWKKIAGKTISPRMAANLLKYGKTGPFKGFISKNKKRFSAALMIKNREGEWQVAFDFETPEFKAKDLKPKELKVKAPKVKDPENTGPLEPACPVCRGKIIEGNKGYGCANWRPEQGNCRFVIWKEISGKTLTPKIVETLISGKATRIYVMKDLHGHKFKARMQMVQTAPNQYALDIVPEEGEPSGSGLQVSCFR